MDKRRIPVLVGVAQLTYRGKTEKQLDPLEMMAEVARAAAGDAMIKNLTHVDTVYVVNCLSRYLEDPARRLSVLLGISPGEVGYTAIGATAPQWLVNRAAERIYSGKSEMVLICGAEAFYTREKIRSMGEVLSSFYAEDPALREGRFLGDIRKPLTDLEASYGLTMPIHFYALFENALRAHWGKSLPGHFREICSFCAHMSEIASKNPFSWSPTARTAQEIGAPEGASRMVVYPYTKWMCANMNVNQAAAVLMASLSRAEALGVPEEKMVFLRGCGDAEDVFLVSERPRLWATPSIREAVSTALEQAPVSLDEVKYFDFYSCFPSAPRMAREMLGISPDDPRPLTVTGGLPYFGGPGNNYALHAICCLVERLRRDREAFGLVQALSWFISKHSVGIYSGVPGKQPWVPPETKKGAGPYPRAKVVEKAIGKGVVESYLVTYDREGNPGGAVIVGRDEDGNRFLARVYPERGVMERMTLEEPIGRSGNVEHDASTRTNWFYFD